MVGSALAPARMPNAAPTPDEGVPPIVNMFVRGADELLKPFDERALSFAASAQRQGPIDVAPMGYMRYIVIDIESDGTGVGAGAVGHEDSPWNVLASVSLEDTAGRPILGPITGYELYQANKRGGYFGFDDLGAYPSFQAITGTGGEFKCKYRIPIEITSRDALGALPNQISSSTFKVFYSLAAEGDVYTTSPLTTTPGVTVKCYLEGWSQPRGVAVDGTGNQTEPPALGTVQSWSTTQKNINAGEQRVTLTRVGNHLRNLILVFRNDSVPSIRESGEFPDQMRLEWDNKIIFETTKRLWLDRMYEIYGFAGDTGVFVIPFIHDADGRAGNENRNLWIPTTSGSKLELIGIFGGAGTLTIMTNDVLVRQADIQAGV